MMRSVSILILSIFLVLGCNPNAERSEVDDSQKITRDENPEVSLVLLGNLQDAGMPHIGCDKDCCRNIFFNPESEKLVISLGLVDAVNRKKYLFEATPNMSKQMKMLKNVEPESENELADGIFLTHAHIGHYSGLMYLGKEAKNSDQMPVYAMPRMKEFLENNGPWSQLVKQNNILIQAIEEEETFILSNKLKVTPFLVPHRDEYSETVGYKIKGPNKSALFIPDIDKWEKWDKEIIDEIEKVDYAFLDGTFYSGEEINYRDISQIPHPFIIESLDKFDHLESEEKKKIVFIHLNHTNPVIDPNSEESQLVLAKGFKIGRMNNVFDL